MREYEGLLLLPPNLDEEGIKNVINNTESIIKEKGGKILSINKWGKRRLAYKISKYSEGFYVLIKFLTPPSSLLFIKEQLNLLSRVLRYLIVRKSG